MASCIVVGHIAIIPKEDPFSIVFFNLLSSELRQKDSIVLPHYCRSRLG